MAETVERRQLWLEEEVGRLGALASLAVPTALAVVALVLPMFRYGTGAGEALDEIDGAAEQATLLGVVLDPGETGPTTAITVAALVVVVGLVVSAASVRWWVATRDAWPGGLMLGAAGATLVAAFVLWVLTNQNDEGGRLGTEEIDPTMQLWLVFVVPVWFLVARARTSSW
ncbi:hypothetical protein [Nocardioides sp.]|uniref:hypothetical protein n=1 Tax=Nocardioides sp. TaxID=35761 RepID=UPI002717DDCC|nr:hypothetical protein [Nocardioides sp.]MDO9456253.1 hypothetical protein [Nocardioides sp.]